MSVELLVPASVAPIELYVISAWDVLRTFGAFVAILVLAVVGTVWVMRPERDAARHLDETTNMDSEDAIDTVPLPRPPQPRNGTIHAPQYQRAAVDDLTVVINRTSR